MEEICQVRNALFDSQERNADLVERLIIAYTQLVLGSQYNQRLRAQLASKENKKRSSNHKVLTNGLPQIITDTAFRQIVARNEANREAAQLEKKAREHTHWLGTVHKAIEERAWQSAKDMHKEAVKAWEAEIMTLKEAKVPKKNWPTKPKCAQKQVVISAIGLSELMENVEGEEGECFDLGLDGSSSDSEEVGED